MEIDYLKEMRKARHEFYKRKIEFQDILDEWEESHQKMGRFHIGINFDQWDEIRVVFTDNVNQEVLDLLCKEFNLQLIGRLPLEPKILQSSEKGNYFPDSFPGTSTANEIKKIVEHVLKI